MLQQRIVLQLEIIAEGAQYTQNAIFAMSEFSYLIMLT